MRWSAKPEIATSLRDVEAIRGFESLSLLHLVPLNLLKDHDRALSLYVRGLFQ